MNIIGGVLFSIVSIAALSLMTVIIILDRRHVKRFRRIDSWCRLIRGGYIDDRVNPVVANILWRIL